MPSRQLPLRKYISIYDLPILPFLAPRVFTPWPKSFRVRRAYMNAQLIEGNAADSGVDDVPSSTVDREVDAVSTSKLRGRDAGMTAMVWIAQATDDVRFLNATTDKILRHSRRSTFAQKYGYWSRNTPVEGHGRSDHMDRTRGTSQKTPGSQRAPKLFPDQLSLSAERVRTMVSLERMKMGDDSMTTKTQQGGQKRMETRGGLDQAKDSSSGTQSKLPGFSGDVSVLDRWEMAVLGVESGAIKKVTGAGCSNFAQSRTSELSSEEQILLNNPGAKANSISHVPEDSRTTRHNAIGARWHGLIRYCSPRAARLLVEAREGRLRYRSIRPKADKIALPVRTKYVRFPFGRSSISTSWTVDFARLSWKYDSHLNRCWRPRARFHRRIRGRGSIAESVASISCEAFTEKWKKLSAEKRNVLWPEIMISTLHRDPASALKFLVATCFKPYPPTCAISDSLDYIVSYFIYRNDNPDATTVAILFRTVIRLLNHFEHNYLHLEQKTIFWLLPPLTTDQTERLYTTLVQCGHPLHENTLLNFANCFARKGRTDLALAVLQRLHDDGADFGKPKIESVCATILQRKYRTGSDVILSDSNIFARMLDLGLQPNIVFYNILLQNAVDAGEFETGWKIHDMILESGTSADAYTYSILLNDAKRRMDRVTIRRILDIVKSKQIKSGHIITDLLHATFLLCEQDRREAPRKFQPSSPFKHMLPLYSEYFDLGPIKDLVTQAYRNFQPQFNGGNLHPNKEALVVMFIALLRGFTNADSAPQWYERFRRLVLAGHPDIAPLAESTHIYDAVIMCLGRWPATLHLCTKVIGDMFSSYSTSVNAEEAAKKLNGGSTGDKFRSSDSSASKGSLFRHCKPSVRTWSILLKAFINHNQPRAAEKVLKMMQSQGITPNQVTWNSLAVGYARMQDIAGTVNVIERLENEGFEVDEWTMSGLQWIDNREALIQALQRKDRRRNEGQQAVEDRRSVEGQSAIEEQYARCVEERAAGIARRLESVDKVIVTAGHFYDQENRKLENAVDNSVAATRPTLRFRHNSKTLSLDEAELVLP